MLLIAYLVLVAIMDAEILSRQSPAALGAVANRALPVNWRIEPGDLSPIAVLGRYATRPVEANRPVTPGDVAATPRLAPNPGEILIAIPAAETPLNAGSHILICPDGAPALGPFVVTAKVCDGGQCDAFLSLPPAKAASLAAIKPPSLRLKIADQGCGK
ncbi:MAG: hypothetical protein JSS35_14095 [Proteobacteria bacterium]|nr:hypothetical protein [Pseudomonadota bacterium]